MLNFLGRGWPAKRARQKRLQYLAGRVARRECGTGDRDQQPATRRVQSIDLDLLAIARGEQRAQDQLRRLEVFLQEDGRSEQRAGVVVKPFTATALRRKQVAGVQVHTEQVAERVVVLRATEPAALSAAG